MDRTLLVVLASVLVLNFVIVPLVGLRLASRRRTAEADRARHWPDVNGYSSILLSRLVVQTCRVLAVERACLLVRYNGDPDRLTVVAEHGLDADVIGRRLPSDAALRSALESASPQRIDTGRLIPVLRFGVPVRSAVATASRGLVLCAASASRREFDAHEVALLGELSGLCASAIEDLAIKQRLDSRVRIRAEEIAMACDEHNRGLASTAVHAASLASEIGTRLRLEPGALIELAIAARVAELGSSEIPEAPGSAVPGEELVHADAIETADRLARVPGLEVVALIVRLIPERWDGRGPEGLPGDQIPLASRILAGCDAIRVLTARRPGRPAETIASAVRRVQSASGTIFDPTVVTALTHELVGEMPHLDPDSVPVADWARADSLYDEYALR
jgi:hypothetical protein